MCSIFPINTQMPEEGLGLGWIELAESLVLAIMFQHSFCAMGTQLEQRAQPTRPLLKGYSTLPVGLFCVFRTCSLYWSACRLSSSACIITSFSFFSVLRTSLLAIARSLETGFIMSYLIAFKVMTSLKAHCIDLAASNGKKAYCK